MRSNETVGAVRSCRETSFRTSDDTELFYRVWPPTDEDRPRRAVVLFHRGHEHSGRWQDFVDRVDLQDCWFFAWDARGHGRSPGERGYAESFGQLVHDADEFVRHVCDEHEMSMSDIAIVGQSVGAVLAATWVHDYAPNVRALVIATPALRIKLYVPLAIPGLRLLRKLRPTSFIRSYVKPKMLTHDKDQAAAYAADELISPQIAVNILLDLHDTSTRLIADAGAITVPCLMLVSGKDWVVSLPPQQQFLDGLSSELKVKELYPAFFHSTFWEKDRARPIERARNFMLARFAEPPARPDLLDADQHGYTRRAYDRLREPAMLVARVVFGVQWLFMKTLGRLSEGIRVGWRAGFDSGESLDHVYRNTAEGTSWLGRFIDRCYLAAPGWRGIRQRKVHMQQMLRQAISALKEAGAAVSLLDIASGPGRYLLDAIVEEGATEGGGAEIRATLCDRDTGGLEAGRILAAKMGVTSVEYRESDAFDAAAIAAIEPRPNLAIVSGLYELFPENAPVRESLRGLSEAVAAGGYLIYTNQPWHPQQEMIARVLPNRDGDPWVMRCRTQAEMDQLVEAAGFDKVRTLIDNDGIFSVSIAQRRVGDETASS